MKNDAQIHHRRSIRLKGYDYTQPGAYFVTISSFQRDEIFGTVVTGVMQLSPIGKIIQTEWFRSAKIRKEIRLFEDEFVVMPNHVHGIVWIVERDIVGADGVRPVIDGVRPVKRDNVGVNGVHPMDGVRPLDGDNPVTEDPCFDEQGTRHDEMGTRRVPLRNHDDPHHEGARRVPRPMAPRSLSSFIAGFKAAVTSRAGRELNSGNIWQRNYYEHIIRNETEFEKIWNYIDSNPLKWQEDQENHLFQGTEILKK
jgi:putative transposase